MTKKPVLQLGDNDNPPDIRYDHIFKAVFTRDSPCSKGALSALISALIHRKVIVDTIVANEPALRSTFNRAIRYDIACQTSGLFGRQKSYHYSGITQSNKCS